jgi:hypothetical protein
LRFVFLPWSIPMYPLTTTLFNPHNLVIC